MIRSVIVYARGNKEIHQMFDSPIKTFSLHVLIEGGERKMQVD